MHIVVLILDNFLLRRIQWDNMAMKHCQLKSIFIIHAVVAPWLMMRSLLLLHTIIFLCKRPSRAVAAVQMCMCARESSEMMIWLDARAFGSSHPPRVCIANLIQLYIYALCVRARLTQYANCAPKYRALLSKHAIFAFDSAQPTS